jgi:hypothetical protein
MPIHQHILATSMCCYAVCHVPTYRGTSCIFRSQPVVAAVLMTSRDFFHGSIPAGFLIGSSSTSSCDDDYIKKLVTTSSALEFSGVMDLYRMRHDTVGTLFSRLSLTRHFSRSLKTLRIENNNFPVMNFLSNLSLDTLVLIVRDHVTAMSLDPHTLERIHRVAVQHPTPFQPNLSSIVSFSLERPYVWYDDDDVDIGCYMDGLSPINLKRVSFSKMSLGFRDFCNFIRKFTSSLRSLHLADVYISAKPTHSSSSSSSSDSLTLPSSSLFQIIGTSLPHLEVLVLNNVVANAAGNRFLECDFTEIGRLQYLTDLTFYPPFRRSSCKYSCAGFFEWRTFTFLRTLTIHHSSDFVPAIDASSNDSIVAATADFYAPNLTSVDLRDPLPLYVAWMTSANTPSLERVVVAFDESSEFGDCVLSSTSLNNVMTAWTRLVTEKRVNPFEFSLNTHSNLVHVGVGSIVLTKYRANPLLRLSSPRLQSLEVLFAGMTMPARDATKNTFELLVPDEKIRAQILHLKMGGERISWRRVLYTLGDDTNAVVPVASRQNDDDDSVYDSDSDRDYDYYQLADYVGCVDRSLSVHCDLMKTFPNLRTFTCEMYLGYFVCELLDILSTDWYKPTALCYEVRQFLRCIGGACEMNFVVHASKDWFTSKKVVSLDKEDELTSSSYAGMNSQIDFWLQEVSCGNNHIKVIAPHKTFYGVCTKKRGPRERE